MANSHQLPRRNTGCHLCHPRQRFRCVWYIELVALAALASEKPDDTEVTTVGAASRKDYGAGRSKARSTAAKPREH